MPLFTPASNSTKVCFQTCLGGFQLQGLVPGRPHHYHHHTITLPSFSRFGEIFLGPSQSLHQLLAFIRQPDVFICSTPQRPQHPDSVGWRLQVPSIADRLIRGGGGTTVQRASAGSASLQGTSNSSWKAVDRLEGQVGRT